MKPSTISTITSLVIADIEQNFRETRDLELRLYGQSSTGDGLCGVDYRDAATSCDLISRDADALRDVLLTAADEADSIDIAAMEARSDNFDVHFEPEQKGAEKE